MTRSLLMLLIGVLAMTACENGAQQPGTARLDTPIKADANLRNVSVSEAAQIIQSRKDAIVLDVRSVQEFAAGHIDGAVNVSFHQPDFKTALSALDKKAPYVLTCESGGRSGKTLRLLKSMGFADVAHMKRGMAGWRNEGLPLAPSP